MYLLHWKKFTNVLMGFLGLINRNGARTVDNELQKASGNRQGLEEVIFFEIVLDRLCCLGPEIMHRHVQNGEPKYHDHRDKLSFEANCNQNDENDTDQVDSKLKNFSTRKFLENYLQRLF